MPQEVSISYQAVKSKVYKLVDAMVEGDKNIAGGARVHSTVVEAHSSFRSCRSPEISAHGAGEVELHAGSHRPRPARGQGSEAGSRPGDGAVPIALRSNGGQQPGLRPSFSSKGPASLPGLLFVALGFRSFGSTLLRKVHALQYSLKARLRPQRIHDRGRFQKDCPLVTVLVAPLNPCQSLISFANGER